MQLIEIIQIVLLIFIALSAIIFLSSYLGYKSKAKIKDFPKPKNEIKKTHHQKPQVVVDLVKNQNAEKPNASIKQNQRFEVFNPRMKNVTKNDSGKSPSKKSHSPKTLVIKPKS